RRVARGIEDVCSSFPAGTMVATEGGPRAIETVQVGDRVWSADLESGELRLSPVSELYTREVTTLYEVETEEGSFSITGEHPVYVQELGWVPASRLEAGDRLVTEDGDPLSVLSVTRADVDGTSVFNFEVEGDHNYFAADGDVLVHNPAKCTKKKPSVPTVRGGKFGSWWDSMKSSEFNSHWNNASYGASFRKTIKRRLRSPGRMHEWVMVSRAEKARAWGLKYAFFADETRTATSSVRFVQRSTGATAGHGGSSISSYAHIEINDMIEVSATFKAFRLRLRRWANGTLPGYDYALVGGAKNLPSGFQ
ncbi:MAG: hypothetical protein KDD47_22735, partial [Acidobacteria bacterium]|nr:hypothetical protein [Acidobacteriota bacterium]